MIYEELPLICTFKFMQKKIVILASGSGSNAENIVRYFKNNSEISVHSILTNNPVAGVVQRAASLDIPCIAFDPQVETPSFLENYLSNISPDLIVLAGYLKKIPPEITYLFPNKIINIHPALLPKFGGKGMYGMHVHRAVKESGEDKTGISIHYVNEAYDEGAIIFQAECSLSSEDTPEGIAEKIHQLEFMHFPKVIESVLNG